MLKPRTAVRADQYEVLRRVFSQTEGLIVELGVDWGLTTEWLVKTFPSRPILAVDLWSASYHTTVLADCPSSVAVEAKYQNVVARLSKFGSRVQLVRADILEYGKNYTGLAAGSIFFDASHEEAGVNAELKTWLPHLSPKGSIVIHDANQIPVRKACNASLTGHTFERGLCVYETR